MFEKRNEQKAAAASAAAAISSANNKRIEFAGLNREEILKSERSGNSIRNKMENFFSEPLFR